MGEDQMVEGMECSEHPYRNNPAGGICAFCLQERLGKLVSSSKPSSFFPAVLVAPNSSSSSPTSFRSDSYCAAAAPGHASGHHSHLGRSKIPPFLSHKQKKVMSSSTAGAAALVLKRSRSVAVPRYMSEATCDDSPRRRGFWSFIHLSRRRAAAGGENKPAVAEGTARAQTVAVAAAASENGCESPNGSHVSSASSFGRKVARSRSVGCGSRSFSGDFLERISTGFGDCTLRRVESQREAKPTAGLHHHRATGGDEDRMKERVRCGGIFAGFGMSSYWFSDELAAAAGRMPAVPHSRNRSWSWAFASPMRAFRPAATTTTIKPSSAAAAVANSASPSLSTVRG